MDTNYQQWMHNAYMEAQLSADPSTQLGCIILMRAVDWKNGIEADHFVGARNHFPPGTNEAFWSVREEKYTRVVHAEQAAIAKAARQGLCIDRATMICPWSCCLRCAGMIVASGISTLVVDRFLMEKSPERWSEEIREAHYVLEKNRIKILFLDYKGPRGIRFNGEVIQ